jgi:hypothetical protein
VSEADFRRLMMQVCECCFTICTWPSHSLCSSTLQHPVLVLDIPHMPPALVSVCAQAEHPLSTDAIEELIREVDVAGMGEVRVRALLSLLSSYTPPSRPSAPRQRSPLAVVFHV